MSSWSLERDVMINAIGCSSFMTGRPSTYWKLSSIERMLRVLSLGWLSRWCCRTLSTRRGIEWFARIKSSLFSRLTLVFLSPTIVGQVYAIPSENCERRRTQKGSKSMWGLTWLCRLLFNRRWRHSICPILRDLIAESGCGSYLLLLLTPFGVRSHRFHIFLVFAVEQLGQIEKTTAATWLHCERLVDILQTNWFSHVTKSETRSRKDFEHIFCVEERINASNPLHFKQGGFGSSGNGLNQMIKLFVVKWENIEGQYRCIHCQSMCWHSRIDSSQWEECISVSSILVSIPLEISEDQS